MSYVERPKWVYNDGGAVTYTMALPQRPWDYGKRQVGGSDVSAAGVPAAFAIRQENLLYVTIRFPVSEWASVERLVRHGQGGGTITFYPDQAGGTNHTVYIDEPAMGQVIRPRRSANDQRTFELDLTLRRTTDALFTDDYES